MRSSPCWRWSVSGRSRRTPLSTTTWVCTQVQRRPDRPGPELPPAGTAARRPPPATACCQMPPMASPLPRPPPPLRTCRHPPPSLDPADAPVPVKLCSFSCFPFNSCLRFPSPVFSGFCSSSRLLFVLASPFPFSVPSSFPVPARRCLLGPPREVGTERTDEGGDAS